MKPIIPASLRKYITAVVFLTAAFIAKINFAIAQLPDCTTGTVMYAIFNDSIGSTSTANPQSEIRPVNFSTGVVGALMGGTTFLIRKTVSGTNYNGSASLGVDVITNRFYAITQMSGPAIAKDIVTINTLTATQTVIATTPASLNSYHFVKLAMHPSNGYGYALGVHRDSTTSASTMNPLVRFSTCGGTPSAGCATASITVLGYLPTTSPYFQWELFNGDLAFDNSGNLYFASAAYRRINAAGRYADARLFRINAADIPGSAGAGIIPMTLWADYNVLDSTVLNGIALDAGGIMYLGTRRFNGIQGTTPAPTFTNQLYRSGSPGSATQIATFGPITTGYSIADLASCYFPITLLENNRVTLSGKYSNGLSNLSWKADSKNVKYFEVQRSDENSNNFITIATVEPGASQNYIYNDPQDGFGKNKLYRIRQVMNTGMGIYSNVLKISFNSKINLVSRPRPNPFISSLDLNVQLKADNVITLRMRDESGRMVFYQRYTGHRGENKLNVTGLTHLRPGIFILEVAVDDEVIREKIVKN
jgi:hypothetical protein